MNEMTVAQETKEAFALKNIQLEMAEVFADLAELFGNPRSLGSIYGLLFTSPEPMSMEEIVKILEISIGSASQGLRRLDELEAINLVKAPGQRTTRYTAKLEMRHYVSIFLFQQLLPKLERSYERISELEATLPSVDPAVKGLLKERLIQASKWHRMAKTLLPMVRGFIRV
jgi:DNA-binding transcriptional regulator GbsR (MarR family)